MGFAVGRKSAVLTAVFMLAMRPAAGQSRALAAADIEEHIQHVTAGLIGGVVLKGQEHHTHTLSERMKTLNVPGVSIAVIHQGKIEWARGFGVGEIGGTPVNAEVNSLILHQGGHEMKAPKK